MFTAPSISTRVLFVLCCTTQLVVWSGCSRMMSPPGQRLFGQNSPSAPESYERSEPDDEGEISPYAADSLQTPSNLGDQIAVPQSRQDLLQAQFAQSYQVPERVPPRLIPIESVEFPGDEVAEVVTASATAVDQANSGEALAIGFSDYSTESNLNDKEVKQTTLLRDQPSEVATPAGSSLAAQQKIVVTPPQPQTKIPTAQAATPSQAAPTSNQAKLNYEKVSSFAQTAKAANAFEPAEFQAARRATKPVTKEASPSDVKAANVKSAIASTNASTNVSPNANGVANPSQSQLETKPATPPSVSSNASANGTFKMQLPELEKISNQRIAKQSASSALAQTPVTPAVTPNKTEPTGDSGLIKAGIKVDKSAFENSVPAKKKTESLNPKDKTKPFNVEPQPVKAQTQPATSPRVSAIESSNSLTLAWKTNPAVQKVSTELADATCSKDPCQTESSTNKPVTGFCGTLPPKPESVAVTPTKVGSSSKLPMVSNEKQANKALALPASEHSQFQPSQPPTLTAKPMDNSRNLSPPAPNFVPASNATKSPATKTQSKEPSPLPAPAKTAAELSSSQPAFKPATENKKKESLSELNLLDRGLPASTSSEKKPIALPLTASKPVSNSAAPIPSQFTSKSPELTSHIEKTPVAPALQLVNCQFCTEIKGFGQITPFQSNRFKNNQRTLVYCEVENYNSQTRTTDKGSEFVTRFRGRYQIVDSKGNVVQSGQFPEIEDVTVRKRRDFYLYFPITLKDLQPASYGLKLTIEESVPEPNVRVPVRSAQQTLQFTVE